MDMSKFQDVWDKRFDDLNTRRRAGERIIGWVCTYVPEEIIFAGGALPIRVMGGVGETPMADAYMYSNICSFVRNFLELGLRGDYDFLDGLIACNSCDHIRRLYDVWRQYIKTPFVHILGLPHKINNDSINFFQKELVQFKKELEYFLDTPITDQSIKNAIEVYNQTRVLLKRLYDLRKAPSPPVSGEDTLKIILTGMVMPRDEYNHHLRAFLEGIVAREDKSEDRVRLLLVGSELEDPSYLKTIEDLGAVVVMDDLCNGARYFWDLVELNGDPLEALARRYLTRMPCARMRPATIRFERLKEIINSFNIDGIIYQVLKFCDMYGAEYPIFREGLKELNIPILALDREYISAGAGQLKTRVQAFLENIGEAKWTRKETELNM